MKLPALLALRKCDPKSHSICQKKRRHFSLNRCLISSILAVSILQAVDAGTELSVGIEKNAKYL
jgi:hypothetical protein